MNQNVDAHCGIGQTYISYLHKQIMKNQWHVVQPKKDDNALILQQILDTMQELQRENEEDMRGSKETQLEWETLRK